VYRVFGRKEPEPSVMSQKYLYTVIRSE
jgi:hypothetical protein